MLSTSTQTLRIMRLADVFSRHEVGAIMTARRRFLGFSGAVVVLTAGLSLYQGAFDLSRDVVPADAGSINISQAAANKMGTNEAGTGMDAVQRSYDGPTAGETVDVADAETTALPEEEPAAAELARYPDRVSSARPTTPGVRTILLWNSWFRWDDYRFGLGRDVFIKKCKTDLCETTTDRGELGRASAVVFFAAMLDYERKPLLPPRSHPEQVYVYLNTEPPAKYPTALAGVRNAFNATISYKSNATIAWPYARVLPRQDQHRPIKKLEVRTRKGAIAWMVSICKDVNARMTYYKELRKHIQVDMYGRCGDLKCPEQGRGTTECIEFLEKRYKFYLAFENSHCVDYVTEKAFRTLQYNLVPIVMGGANYTRYLPPKSFIDVKDFQSPRHLAKYLHFLDRNPDEYLKYFEWKRDYVVEFDIPNSDGIFCELCSLLLKNTTLKLDYDVADWWQNDTCIDNNEELRRIYHINGENL